jgi:hypothetical protein
MIRKGGNRFSEQTARRQKAATRSDDSNERHPAPAGERPAVTVEARVFRVDTNFQRMARRPGGISRDRAIERAETEIAEVKVDFNEWLARELAELAHAFASAREHRQDPERLSDLAGRSRELRDVTAMMRFELLSFVAASLCDLMDSIDAEAEFPVDSIACHLDSLNLAARPAFRRLRPDQVPELTKGLRRVVRHASA